MAENLRSPRDQSNRNPCKLKILSSFSPHNEFCIDFRQE